MSKIIIRVLKWLLVKLEPTVFAPHYIYPSQQVDYSVIEVYSHINMDEVALTGTNLLQVEDYLRKRAELDIISQICEKIKPFILLQTIEQPITWRKEIRGKIIVGKFNTR